MFARCSRRPATGRTHQDMATAGKKQGHATEITVLSDLPLFQSQLIQQLVSSDPSKRLDAGSVLRMDFLKTQDELVTQLKATVEQQASQMKELMELLAEKEDMIKLLQQQLTEANNRTHLYDSQSI